LSWFFYTNPIITISVPFKWSGWCWTSIINFNTSASYALNATSASFAQTASFYGGTVVSASYALNSTSASYALTASFALNGGGGGISAISIADEGILLGSASYFDFTGAGVTAAVSAGTASFTISGGGGGNSGLSTFFTQSVAAVTWSFTHNLNTRTPLVQVYDSGYQQITPQYVSASNGSTVEIGFGIATSGFAVASTGGTLYVTGSNVIFDQPSAAATWSFSHNLNTQYPVFQVFDSNNEVIIPQVIKAVDSTSVLIYFPIPVAGKAVASLGGLSGSISVSSASFATTASYSLVATSASYASASTSASFATNALTASYLSGYVSPFPYTGSAIISGSLTVTGSILQSGSFTSTGTITAQTLVVQTVTSSIIYSSGSNIFGNDLANTQVLTGSVTVTGSLAVNGSNVILTNQTSSMSASYALNATSASFATNALTASYVANASSFPFTGSAIITGSLVVTGSVNSTLGFTGSLLGTATTASYVTTAQTASFVTTAQTASYVLQAVSASYVSFAYSPSNPPGFTVQFTQSVAAATWSFNHNMNTRNPIVQVYDSLYRQIVPNDIIGVSVNTAEIRFNYNESGYVVMSNGGGLYVTGSTSLLSQTSAATTWSFAHNLNSKYVNFEVYDSNDYVIVPVVVRLPDKFKEPDNDIGILWYSY